MCYASVHSHEGASITGRARRGAIAVFAALMILSVASGCVHRSGTMATGGGTVYNNATFNITPGPVLTPMGLKGPATRASDSGQTVLPSATAESSQGVSATGVGNIVIQFRQGSTETQAPAASGINATIPVTVPESSQSLIRSRSSGSR